MILRLVITTMLLLASACGITTGPQRPTETQDRLTPDKMEQLVEGPMRSVHRGDLLAGNMEFQRLLARARLEHGEGSVEVADLLTSFGVLLYLEGKQSDDQSLKAAAVEHLRPAIDAYRRAFGPRHAEVAVALHTYASALIQLRADDPPQEAERVLKEAYDMRAATLGKSNHETRAALLWLADLKGTPAWVSRDPAQLSQSVELFERLLIDAPSEPLDVSGPRIRFALARVYARNGKGEDALKAVEQARKEVESQKSVDGCLDAGIQVRLVANALREGGNPALAEKVSSSDLEQLMRCAAEG